MGPWKFVSAIIEEAVLFRIVVPKDAVQKIRGQDIIFIFDKELLRQGLLKRDERMRKM